MNRPANKGLLRCAAVLTLSLAVVGCQGETGPGGGGSGGGTNNPLLGPLGLGQGNGSTDSGNNSGNDPGTTPPPPPPPPQPPPPPPIQVNLPAQKHYVMTNRQKYVGLQGYVPGVEYDSMAFAVVGQPTNGVLLGTAPNLAYVPNANFTGVDSFEYTATGGGYALRRRIDLHVEPDYVLPIGVPEPEFGIAETHMMYVGEMFDFGNGPELYRNAGSGPYTHYINFNTGSDTNNPFGTAANPRRTLPANLPAGSVVELHGVGFNATHRHTIRGNGTVQKPIFVRGSSPLAKPVFRRPIWIEGDYIVLENIDFDCSENNSALSNTGTTWIRISETINPDLRTYHHVAIRHCLFRDQPARNTSGMAAISALVDRNSELANTSTDLVEHVLVYDVEVRNFAQWNDYVGTQDYGGVTFHANTRYGWVLDCHLHHIRGDATAVSRNKGLSNQVPPHYIHFGRNYMHNLKENGIDYKLARHSVFSQNIVHTVRQSDSSNGDAVLIQSTDTNLTWQSCDDIWVIFNEIYDAERGIFHATSGVPEPGFQSRSYMVGNVIYDIRAIRGNPDQRGIGISKPQLSQSRIIGNTIYNCEHGIWSGLTSNPYLDLSGVVIRNNVIADLSERYFNDTGQHGLHLMIRPHAAIPYTEIDHNLHWESVGSIRLGIVNSNGSLIGYTSSAAMQAVYPQFGGGNVDQLPLFENAPFAVLNPQIGTPCTDGGTDDEAYTLFETQYGRSIRFYQDETPITPGHITLGALPAK